MRENRENPSSENTADEWKIRAMMQPGIHPRESGVDEGAMDGIDEYVR